MKRKFLSAALAAMPCIALAAGEANTLDAVVVVGQRSAERFDGEDVGSKRLTAQRAATSDTASLLRDVPGVSLYGAGAVSSLPAIHGMADDRVRVKLDGMDLISSCPNHMNPALSYIDPTNVGTIKVYAGITPVSVGGDSIGGTIVAETPAPEFAAPGQANLFKGEAGAFYRSNNKARGGNIAATYATDSFNITYSGATSAADNYKAAGDFKTFSATGNGTDTLPLNEVGSSAYKTTNQTLGVAFKGANHLIEAKLGLQDMPKQLYPNQRMDLLDNSQNSLNLRYLGQLAWGTLDARVYHEKVTHFMEFGPDKKFAYTAGNTTQGMPMKTEGKTTGATIKASIDLSKQDLLRVGGEVQQYRLNDWWPAVALAAGMGPNDFLNINNGERNRTSLFGEWEQRLSKEWLTLLGLRFERVNTNAGMVHGYNLATFPTAGAGGMMNQTRDAVGFNNANRDKTDNNWDLTALARYTPSTSQDIEFGFARKVRSPNLYERYSWSTANMMSIMNNYVGDGNGYIGDVNLKPEKAHTLSATFDWHAADRTWEFKATPYYTRVTDYIDAVQWNGTTNLQAAANATNQFVALRYTNQSARLYGIDLSGRMPLAKTGLGELGLKGLLNYTNGKNRDTGDDLYNIMPLNAKLTLTQKLGGWDNGIELVMVEAKSKVSDVRNEIKTAGYSLVNLRASYSWKQTRVDFGIENLFNKFYSLPLGGAYTGQGTTMGLALPWNVAVPGMGRSLYAGVNYKF
jgi:iron complex outermembrane receptor protein